MSEASAQVTRPDTSSKAAASGWTDCDLDPSISTNNDMLARQGITHAVVGRLPHARVTLSPEPDARSIATRFVIPAPPNPNLATLRDLHARGVRGVRFGLSDDADRMPARLDKILRYTDRIAGCNWHVELELRNGGALLSDCEWTLMRFPVAVCFSGITDVAARRALDDPETQFILALLRIGRTWIKLSGAVSGPCDGDARRRIETFVSAALAARRDRIVWSSGALQAQDSQAAADSMAHVTGALATLRQWIPDDADRAAVLAANPSQLYGFAPPAL